MKDWRKIVVDPETIIIEAIKILDKSAMQILLVVGMDDTLLGSVTDGDVRRGILKNIPLESPIATIMNPTPVMATEADSRKKIISIMKRRSLKHIPIVNDKKQLINLYVSDELNKEEQKDNWVILMAGGLGTRLRPLTEDLPKPLLQVGNKPILENILEKFIDHNFQNFYISVNYKAELIKDYFQNGNKWGVNIQYIDEQIQLGTAGALSLLPVCPDKPIIVMNGDLLTKVNFGKLLAFHQENNSMATMCVREYEYQVPYGVIKTSGHELLNIEEKPSYQYFVNAGIYVLNPEVFKSIPKNEFFDMPTLFKDLIEKKMPTNVYPIREYWLDIGRMQDFEKANNEFYEVFQ
jgi:dTDP-glucose pyrophosphorylase